MPDTQTYPERLQRAFVLLAFLEKQGQVQNDPGAVTVAVSRKEFDTLLDAVRRGTEAWGTDWVKEMYRG
jgi:hypothetical protein